jgi:hypothetical protein
MLTPKSTPHTQRQQNHRSSGFATVFILCVLACMLYVSIPFLLSVGPAAIEEAKVEFKKELSKAKYSRPTGANSAPISADANIAWLQSIQAQLYDFAEYSTRNNIPDPVDVTDQGLLDHLGKYSTMDTANFKKRLALSDAGLMWFQGTISITASQ